MGIQINGNTNNINAGIGSLSIEDLNELDIVGVATASNFKTGVSNLHDVGLTLSGGQIDVGSNIKIGTAGIITATGFVPAADNSHDLGTNSVRFRSLYAHTLYGNGANITNLTAANLTGALPAIDGSNLTGISAGTALSGSTNNTVCTVTGANAIQGEANLTFNGTTLTVSGFIESVGNSGRGAKLGNIAIGYSPNNNTVQSLSNGSNLHLQYSVNGNVFANEGGGYLQTRVIRPETDSQYDIGTNSVRYANIYADTLIGYDGEFGQICIGGTPDAYQHIQIKDANPRFNLLSSGTNAAKITFGDSGDTDSGTIEYQHSGTEQFKFSVQSGDRMTLTTSALTVNGTIESTGTSGRGARLGQISVGHGSLYNTIQNTVADTPIHLQYNNTGNIKCNEGGGDMQTRDIFPESNNSYSLGTDAKRWANIHTNDLNLSNEGSTNDVDGTWGQYTIQEGEHDLFLINKRNGKRYKFNLTEVD